MSTKLTFRNTAEENRAILNEKLWASEDEQNLIESMKRNFGVDPRDSKEFPVNSRSYSWKKTAQKLTEADSLSLFPQVLRAGVQSIVNSMYQSVPTTFEEWAHTVNSNRIEELYAPIQGINFPSQVGEGEVYPEVAAAGLDMKLRNNKYGTLYPISRELLDDDQTGQFQKMSGLLGVYAKQVLEVLCYGKLASVANMRYGNIRIPVSETQPSTEPIYPWSISLVGGGATRGAVNVSLNQANIQAAFIALMNQKNLLGLKMQVQPDSIIASPHYNFDLKTLLNSAYYPTGATAGSTGGAFSINPIEGLAKPIISRFVFDQNGSVAADSKAWYVCDSKVPAFVCQIREAAVVEMENPASGMSFDRDTIRFKVRIRANADFIDPRFFYRGSDGSV
ncbi:hypothetical protein EBT16_04130 [bacterium]|nr:hypothetical protein [bacterium]